MAPTVSAKHDGPSRAFVCVSIQVLRRALMLDHRLQSGLLFRLVCGALLRGIVDELLQVAVGIVD